MALAPGRTKSELTPFPFRPENAFMNTSSKPDPSNSISAPAPEPLPQPAQLITSRRQFLKSTGQIAAVSALAGVAIPRVHAADSQTINVALIGCGGRGTGAAANALSVKDGSVKLTAMADVFQHRLDGSYKALEKHPRNSMVDVPQDRKFIGFDAYQEAMDTLRPGTLRFSPRRWRFAGCILDTPSRRG
jgi:hypothetical protein